MTKNETNQSAIGNNEVGGNLVVKGHIKQDSRDYSINMKLVERNNYVFATPYTEETYPHDDEKYFGLRKIERVAVNAYNWFTAHIEIIFTNSYPDGELKDWKFHYVEELMDDMYGADFEIDFSFDVPDDVPDNFQEIGIYNKHAGRYFWRIRLLLNENGNVEDIRDIKNTCPVPPGVETPDIWQEISQLIEHGSTELEKIVEETTQVVEQGYAETKEAVIEVLEEATEVIESVWNFLCN